ncbi:hypothetical protein GCM10009551_092860 [Nocardiopsis tropica]|uniref:hypothetical protein n=1 Tax=Tsukamurella TaxID=2060 RepID=UPI001C7DD46C|nr:hypothetical protein [Tsukamurella sp. TY48]GIZ97952.1 hypothetical protein TTY48_25640 [Tsukamurella sp. TY48]
MNPQRFDSPYRPWPPQPGQARPSRPARSTGALIGIVVAATAVVIALIVVGTAVALNRAERPAAASAMSSGRAPSVTTPSKPMGIGPGFGLSDPPPKEPLITTVTNSTIGGDKDWLHFQTGGGRTIDLKATLVRPGRDYPDCRTLDRSGKLARLGCTQSADMVHSADGGQLFLNTVVFSMRDEAAAQTAESGYQDHDLTELDGTYRTGYAKAKYRISTVRNFFVVTLATAAAATPEATMSQYLRVYHGSVDGVLIAMNMGRK